jgi:hypothetical protein
MHAGGKEEFNVEGKLQKRKTCYMFIQKGKKDTYYQNLECDYRQGLDWIMYLLNTLTHDPELQAVTAPPLISTIHKSPQNLQSLLHPAVSS